MFILTSLRSAEATSVEICKPVECTSFFLNIFFAFFVLHWHLHLFIADINLLLLKEFLSQIPHCIQAETTVPCTSLNITFASFATHIHLIILPLYASLPRQLKASLNKPVLNKSTSRARSTYCISTRCTVGLGTEGKWNKGGYAQSVAYGWAHTDRISNEDRHWRSIQLALAKCRTWNINGNFTSINAACFSLPSMKGTVDFTFKTLVATYYRAHHGNSQYSPCFLIPSSLIFNAIKLLPMIMYRTGRLHMLFSCFCFHEGPERQTYVKRK